MARISWYFEGAANGTGERQDKYLCDISEKLSEYYGRLIRQGQTFTIRSIDVRLVNPDQSGEIYDDEVIAVSGMFNYYEPTKNRISAWKNGFQAWLNNRRALGVKSRGADFRVGLADGYSTDVGAFGDGVKFNSWINADDDPLMLNNANDHQSLFRTWNENVASQALLQPTNPNGGFGHWAQKDADALLDELDFVTNENYYYTEDQASTTSQRLPFMLNFSAWFDNGTSDPEDFGSVSNAEHIAGPHRVMCGVVGVYIDTVAVDDSESENQDYGIEISMDIEKWTPLLPRRSKKSKKAKK